MEAGVEVAPTSSARSSRRDLASAVTLMDRAFGASRCGMLLRGVPLTPAAQATVQNALVSCEARFMQCAKAITQVFSLAVSLLHHLPVLWLYSIRVRGVLAAAHSTLPVLPPASKRCDVEMCLCKMPTF